PEDLGRSYAEMLGEGAWDATPPESPSLSGVEAATPPPPLRIIEALLFVGGPPLTSQRACQVIRGMTAEQFTQCIDELNRTYRRQDRPYSIQLRDQGYALQLKPKFRGVMEKLYGGVREARLSTQAIAVLPLVADRQPATK